MEDNEIVKQEIETEETKPGTTNEEQAESLTELVDSIKTSYETQITKMQEKYKNEIRERDKVIQQLLSGNDDSNGERETFIDRLNKKRAYKKW